MEKLIYALWRRPEQALAPIAEWMRTDVLECVTTSPQVRGARVLIESADESLETAPNPHGQLCGSVSIWVDTYQDRQDVDEVMRNGRAHAFHTWLVTESVPTAYGDDLTWPTGERSPGISQLTLFDRNPNVDEERFLYLWHVLHRKTTRDVHPLWTYNRNYVVRSLTNGAPRLRGIVYQSVREVRDVVDRYRFYGAVGDEEKYQSNLSMVHDETAAFIDFDTIQNQRMHEYLGKVVSS